MILNFPTESYDSVLRIMQGSGQKFSAVVSRNRREIVTEGGDTYKFQDAKIPMRDLSLIKAAKSEMSERAAGLDMLGPQDVAFYRVGLKNGQSYFSKDVVEIDISKAYWCAALKLGLITERTYKRGLEVEKVSRLAAVGACAVTKWRFEFDGSSFCNFTEQFDPVGRSAFFNVCREVSRALNEAAGNIAHLLWVDAIFCDAKHADDVCERLAELGYEYKRKGIVWANYTASVDEKRLSYLEKMGEENEKICPVRVKTFKFALKKNKKFQEKATEKHFSNVKSTKSTEFYEH